METYVSMGRIDSRGQLVVFLATPRPPNLYPPHTSLTHLCPANLPHSFVPGPICQAIPSALYDSEVTHPFIVEAYLAGGPQRRLVFCSVLSIRFCW